MTAKEEKTKKNKEAKKEVQVKNAVPSQESPNKVAKRVRRSGGRHPRARKGKSRKRKEAKDDDGFDKKIISIRRVTRVYKGGKRMRLSVFLVVGDKKGMVGLGLGKGPDVRSAEEKAYNQAKKNMVMVNLKDNTIPHEVNIKYGAAKLMMKPASPGTGIIAGSSVRAVVELAGVKDILAKQLGARNQINNAYAALKALKSLRNSRL
jgi:small subunit ribosomal protein S5